MLSRDDLYSLEEYAEMRSSYRADVMAHKKPRAIHLGEHCTLYFEDRKTIQYQIQEMLRIEKIFEADGINEELEAYNPLIPTGNNWKATFMIEFEDVDERRAALSSWLGIEDTVWVQVAELGKVYAIANEDLERTTAEKTSSVHFMRFELSDEMVAAACGGAAISMGIDLSLAPQETALSAASRDSLTTDLACS